MTTLLPSTRRPDVSFYSDGHIDISKHLATQMQLQQDDVINIAEDKGELYLFVKMRAGEYIGTHQGRVRKTRCNRYRVSSSALCKAVFRIAGAVNRPVRLPAGQAIDIPGYGRAFPLIVKHQL